MRRFSAVLHHRKAGFSANAMGVWAARGSDADILAAGEAMARFKSVSHCYRRPTYPDWPFNLFTMIHGRTAEDCEAVLAEISRETGITEFSVLYSTKEFKKTRVEYFTDAEARWESAT
jgi:DNA-binding Lrp family transcriptional regulator